MAALMVSSVTLDAWLKVSLPDLMSRLAVSIPFTFVKAPSRRLPHPLHKQPFSCAVRCTRFGASAQASPATSSVATVPHKKSLRFITYSPTGITRAIHHETRYSYLTILRRLRHPQNLHRLLQTLQNLRRPRTILRNLRRIAQNLPMWDSSRSRPGDLTSLGSHRSWQPIK